MNSQKQKVQQILLRIIEFTFSLEDIVYLIHDRAGEFGLRYQDYGITGITTSIKAPNMNSIAKRFMGSVRRELLDNFIIISQDQLYYLLKTYIEHYNTKRPHQGIGHKVPKSYAIQNYGMIKSKPTLFGLNYEFYREAA